MSCCLLQLALCLSSEPTHASEIEAQALLIFHDLRFFKNLAIAGYTSSRELLPRTLPAFSRFQCTVLSYLCRSSSFLVGLEIMSSLTSSTLVGRCNCSRDNWSY